MGYLVELLAIIYITDCLKGQAKNAFLPKPIFRLNFSFNFQSSWEFKDFIMYVCSQEQLFLSFTGSRILVNEKKCA